MAKAIATLRIMPESPDVNLVDVEKKSISEIKKFAGDTETKVEIEPIAFGLKAVKILFVFDESKGATDSLEAHISKIHGVQSVEIIDIRRAIG